MTKAKDEKSTKLGKFQVPRHGAFYKGERKRFGDIVEVAAEADWRPWMVPVTVKIPEPKSFAPPEAHAQADQKTQ